MKRKVIMLLSVVALCVLFAGTALAENKDYVVDNADILTDSEEAELEQKAAEVSQRQGLDIVLLTVNSLEGKTVANYADDFYFFNGYGQGESSDGVIMTVAMDDRKWGIETTGYGITALTDYGMDLMDEAIVPYLGDGDYVKAFGKFIEMTDDYVTRARNGSPVDTYDEDAADKSFPWGIRAAISAAIGLLAGFLGTGSMKSKLKTVYSLTAAEDNIINQSLFLNKEASRDLFLYNNIVQVPIATDNNNGGNSSGGSTTHVSSSGMTHGGHSGNF